jgi:hypothetical protein
MFERSDWIWNCEKNEPNTYTQFIDDFPYEEGKAEIYIACDSKCCFYVNGRLAGFGQYSDYPEYKVYNTVDITPFLEKGSNRLAVSVWYFGTGSMCYAVGNAGLIYEVMCGGKTVAYSGKHTLCRSDERFDKAYTLPVTGQLGYGFSYDATKEDCWTEPGETPAGFAPSVIRTGVTKILHPRPIEPLRLEDRVPVHMVQQGEFTYGGQEKLASRMMHAYLSFQMLPTMSGLFDDSLKVPIPLKSVDGNGVYFIIDCGGEEAGFLDFDIETEEACQIDISYGEHLVDGRVRAEIYGRNFCVQYKARKGRQRYCNELFRFGGRYFQYYVHAPKITVYYAGLRPTVYPAEKKPFQASDALRRQIYDTSVRTLILCMHEHYEDTPWREQCLYTLDSWMQMLYGFYAFKGFAFARAALSLMRYGVRDEGRLSITFPTDKELNIPMFTLIYPIQVTDYTAHSKDLSLAEEVYPILENIFKEALRRLRENGLVLDYDKPSWNFYEWIYEYHGMLNCEKRTYDLILNCMLSYSLAHMAKLSQTLGKDGECYSDAAARLNRAVYEAFYDKEKKLFRSFIGKYEYEYGELGNSLAILCGACFENGKTIVRQLADPLNGMTKITLPMQLFKYRALLQTDKTAYAEAILSEVDRNYFHMLRNGATSFWETMKGESDFDRAGSLCHGWSALPIFVYQLLDK